MWVYNMKDAYEMYAEAACAGQDDKDKNVRHYLEISVPVEVRPEVKVGRIEAYPCGEPVVMCDECKKNNKKNATSDASDEDEEEE